MNSEEPEITLENAENRSADSPLHARPEALPELPRLSRGVIWAEVAAVLAIGVIPHLWTGLRWYALPLDEQPLRPTPYWLDSLDLSLRSCCVIIPVLFLMYRSRERFAYFGLARPRWIDPLLGVGLFVFWEFAWRVVYSFFQPGFQGGQLFFPPPRQAGDYALMVMKYSANVFAEELVTRAYLITRFQFLLKSKFRAVVVAAMFFSSYHIYGGVAHVVSCFVVAMLMGAVFLSTRRIWPGIFGHFLMDVRADLAIVV